MPNHICFSKTRRLWLRALLTMFVYFNSKAWINTTSMILLQFEPFCFLINCVLLRREHTLCCKIIPSFSFLWCKMPMFWRVGMRGGGKPLPLATLWFEFGNDIFIGNKIPTLRGLQFHCIKWLKKGHFKFKVLAFWSQWRYDYQIKIKRPLYHKNQILKC